jgi:hypothetical protein
VTWAIAQPSFVNIMPSSPDFAASAHRHTHFCWEIGDAMKRGAASHAFIISAPE